MGEIEKLKSFVEGVRYREQQLQNIDPQKGRFPFVTISRDTGAGGHLLADRILELISAEKDNPVFQDWQICDQELCHKIVQDPKIHASLESLLMTEYRSPAEDLIAQFITGESGQEKILRRLFRLMRDLAVFGKAIIIGRGSTCLTRDLPYGVHVRLTASLPSRIALIMKTHGKDEKWSRETIQEQDKAKAALVKTYFHRDIQDPLIYDAVWNTDRVPIETIAHFVVSMIHRKAKSL